MDKVDPAFLIIIGIATVTVIGWVAKILIEKIISKFFKDAESLAELKESMLNEKINRVSSDMASLSTAIKHSAEEFVRHKIMMQSLTHDISTLRAEIKSSEKFNQKSFQDLAKILSYVNSQLKKQSDELTTLGKIIFKDWPEGKS